MGERALVLGGGGTIGLAWEVGLISGLAQEGVDVSRADKIFGTSAGSFVGAQLASGLDAPTLAELHMAFARQTETQPPPGPAPKADDMLAYTARLPRDSAPSPELMAEMGKVALHSTAVPPEAEYLARFAGMFGPSGEWPKRFACCTVNAFDGTFRVWTEADRVSIERAVAASCSVPGVTAPVALADSLWIDGAVRSWTNADCAAGHRRVLVVAVVAHDTREPLTSLIERERAVIHAAHGTSEFIVPDQQSLRAFGDNLMAPPRGTAVTEAGIAQGRREAARLSALWD